MNSRPNNNYIRGNNPNLGGNFNPVNNQLSQPRQNLYNNVPQQNSNPFPNTGNYNPNQNNSHHVINPTKYINPNIQNNPYGENQQYLNQNNYYQMQINNIPNQNFPVNRFSNTPANNFPQNKMVTNPNAEIYFGINPMNVGPRNILNQVQFPNKSILFLKHSFPTSSED